MSVYVGRKDGEGGNTTEEIRLTPIEQARQVMARLDRKALVCNGLNFKLTELKGTGDMKMLMQENETNLRRLHPQ